jgi:hypothetical protein
MHKDGEEIKMQLKVPKLHLPVSIQGYLLAEVLEGARRALLKGVGATGAVN